MAHNCLMDRLEAFRIIAAEARRGELAFPTHVEASLKLHKLLAGQQCHVADAARLVQAEPLLAARTVAVANCVAYNRSGHDVTSVKDAIVRIGFRTLGTLVMSVIARQLTASLADPLLRAMSRQLWEHSVHVAVLSRVIAARTTRLDPDTALFAGIVHEIGGFYLLSRAAEFPWLLCGDWGGWVEHGEAEVGRAVLLRLDVPPQVHEGIEAMWRGLRALPPVTLADTLLLANDLAPVHSPLLHRDGTSREAAATIDFTTGRGTLAAILDESDGEAQSLIAALL